MIAGGRRVHMLTMGGTIAATLGPHGYAPVAADDRWAELAPEGISVTVEDLVGELSFGVTFEQVGRLVQRIATVLDDPAIDGVVVTHGTAVMEEVAYLCDITLDAAKPVVFTGATYHASDPGSDGPHNVVDALRLASSDEIAQEGVVICFAGEIHSARDVLKLNKFNPSPFESPAGRLGFVTETSITLFRRASGRITLSFPRLPIPKVYVLHAVMDIDDELVDAVLKTGPDGLVVEGFPGGGGVPPSLLEGCRRAIASAIPVVATSRAPFGPMVRLAAHHSGPAVLDRIGAIGAGDLPSHKARLLLIVCLSEGLEAEEIAGIFRRVADHQTPTEVGRR